MAAFFALLLIGLGYVSGYSEGISRGYYKANDDVKRFECENEFKNTSYQEIEGRCLKYFPVKK